MMTSIPQSAFDRGTLDATFHERLLADLPRWAGVAGIPQKFVWTPLAEVLKPAAIQWAKEMKWSDNSGLVFTGKQSVPVTDMMMGIAGFCLRNYVDARVMIVQDIVQRLKDGDMVNPTVLLIPNFHMDIDGGDVAPWQTASLLGLLYKRMAQEKKTILYCAKGFNALEKAYGAAMREHIETHFTLAT